jgi:hypothetical protein
MKKTTQIFRIAAYCETTEKKMYFDYADGELIPNDYGVKVFLNKKIWASERGFYYILTEYYTGMMICNTNTSKKKDAIKLFEKLFNDPDLTDLGRKDKLDSFHRMIDENVEVYGCANSDITDQE